MRNAKETIILGTNGTGKTTLIKKILESYITAKPGRKGLVITSHQEEWRDLPNNDLAGPDDFQFVGLQRHIMRPDYTVQRLKYFYHGVIVFDDCKVFIGDKNPDLEQILLARRQQAVDIIYVAHGFTRVPPFFYPYYSEIILFRTNDNIAQRKNVILNYEKVLAAQTRVNKKAIKKPHHCEIIRSNE